MQPQLLKVQYEEEKEDIILRKRKRRLNEEQEFIADCSIEAKFENLKRQRLSYL